jgi:hypothetical protein
MRSAVAASLVVLPSMPAFADGVTTLLPDERDVPMRLLALIGPVVAIVVLTILGLTITFRALSHDRRDRRIVYRQRGQRAHERAPSPSSLRASLCLATSPVPSHIPVAVADRI